MVYMVIGLSILFVFIYFLNFENSFSYILSRFLGILFSAGFFYLIFITSDGKWIGGGDVKLCVALGLLLGGPISTVLMLFIASFSGCLVALFLVITKQFKPKMTIAFGPLLIISTIICFLYDTQILNWYTKIIG
jgi:prepilin signal peptidase PulO-like enzyme (type II secretory pathway)